MNWNLQHIEKLYEDGKILGYKINGGVNGRANGETGDLGRKKSKFGNKRIEIQQPDGTTLKFASKREANRHYDLKMLQIAGFIKDLRLQVKYELNEGGTHSYSYIADFEYLDLRTNSKITEDCKGYRTVTYKKKRNLMKKLHGITILET